jgi:hypothetical protein
MTDIVDLEALEFFNRISGRLAIKLSEEPQRAAPHMLNLVSPPSARVTNVSFVAQVLEQDKFRDLTEAEWSRVVLRTPDIRMRSGEAEDTVVRHSAPNGREFTVRDLANAIEETERQARGDSNWMGGVDVHHIFFEGITFEEGAWYIGWGS